MATIIRAPLFINQRQFAPVLALGSVLLVSTTPLTLQGGGNAAFFVPPHIAAPERPDKRRLNLDTSAGMPQTLRSAVVAGTSRSYGFIIG